MLAPTLQQKNQTTRRNQNGRQKLNFLFILPRELRDEIYHHLFASGHRRLRLVNTKEKARIVASTEKGEECRAWPTRDSTPAVISSILEGTALLATNRQIYDESMEVLLRCNDILLVTRIASFKIRGTGIWGHPVYDVTKSESMIFSHARVLEISLTSWHQLDTLVTFLQHRAEQIKAGSAIPFRSLTISFPRLLYDLDYDESHWQKTRARVLQLARVSKVAERARIVWIQNLEGSSQREVFDYVQKSMTGQGDRKEAEQ
jgi:hypothetical protein